MLIPDQLPDELKRSAVSLSDAGVAGYAWHIDDTYVVIDWLATNTDYVILGGDLYLFIKRKDVIYPLRENWYYTPTKVDSDQQSSVEKAKEFIARYRTSVLQRDMIVDLALQ